MKQCIDIPRGWQRVIKSQNVIYITPSSDELKSKDDILQYLTSPGTCKCGLQCPLHLDSLFSFDASIRSKDSLEKSRVIESTGEKFGKSHSTSYQANETVKGPPVSHSCNLKTVKSKKHESTKVGQLIPTPSSRKNLLKDQSEPLKETLKSVDSCSTKKPAVEGTLGSSSGNKLPPISIFCQVNKYTVHQILQLLYSSLERRAQKLRCPLKQIQNPDAGSIPKDVLKSSSQSLGNTHSKPSKESNIHAQVDMKSNEMPSSAKNKHNPPYFKSPEHTLISNSADCAKVARDMPITSHPPLVLNQLQSIQTSRNVPETQVRKASDKQTSRSKTHDTDLSKPNLKQQKPSGNMLQIVQSESSRGQGNQPHMLRTPYGHPNHLIPAMSRYPSNYYPMNQHVMNPQQFHQHAMNHQAMLRMQGYNQQYIHQSMMKPYLEHPSLDDKRTKNKAKSKSKQPAKISKQPAIVIQPDKSKIRIDGSSKPTLLVSLGDYGEKKTPSKSSKTSSDQNLTSVDSILKTCSNPNLGNIPDIDHNDVNSEHHPSSKPAVTSEQTSLGSKTTAASPAVPPSQFSNSMIPVQYLTPSSLLYGVPLIQNESKPTRDHKSSKSVEKWEGVLSPSEVDAKVQQILSSPQKSEESSQSVEKESSPKKRKRQQSAPHMYDRYPGNPALRFQTGHAVKAAKLSKSEPHTPSNTVMSSGSIPVVQNIPISSIAPPQWAQFQSGGGQIPPFSTIHPMPGQVPQIPDLSGQSEGRKSH